jgi:hypothetical protein
VRQATKAEAIANHDDFSFLTSLMKRQSVDRKGQVLPRRSSLSSLPCPRASMVETSIYIIAVQPRGPRPDTTFPHVAIQFKPLW